MSKVSINQTPDEAIAAYNQRIKNAAIRNIVFKLGAVAIAAAGIAYTVHQMKNEINEP